MTELREKDNVWPELSETSCIIWENKIYFFAGNMNALYSVDLADGRIKPELSISNEYFDTAFLVSNLLKYQNEMICVPCYAKQIHIIDMIQKKEKCAPIPSNEIFPAQAYYNGCIKDTDCYLFPFAAQKMLRVDLKLKRITQEIDLQTPYKNFTGKEATYFSCSRCCVLEEKIYMITRDAPVILEYDISSMSPAFYWLNGDCSTYIYLTGSGKYLYILGYEGRLFVWNIHSHRTEQTLNLELREGESERFKHSVKLGKYIYLFRYIPSNEFIQIDIETNHAEVLSLRKIFDLNVPMDNKFTYMAAYDEKLYFMSEDRSIYAMNIERHGVDIIPLVLDKAEIMEFIKEHMYELEDEVVTASEGRYVWTIRNFLEKSVISTKAEQKERGVVGDAIYMNTK